MKQIFLYINLIVILIGVTLLSSCTKPSDRTPLAMEKGEFSNHESRKENTPPSQSETNAKEERKEFTFFDISVREIYGGLGNSTGSIG